MKPLLKTAAVIWCLRDGLAILDRVFNFKPMPL